jgi:pimeloyl-ACP methyl ester carboxylesterase
MPKARWWVWVLLALAVLVTAGTVIWSRLQHEAMPEALNALKSDGQVSLSDERWLVFAPASQAAHTGLVLYPGAFVDPRAYAPTARDIAAEGYLVVIVPMPLNLAVLGANRAKAVIDAYPKVDRWVVGGHSLGGAMSARYAHRNPDAVQGLALWAAYPASSDDLSVRSLSVTSIYGTRDGLTTPAKVDASRPLLPASTEWKAIKGGNHAQFGWYGPQSGDGVATVSREEQQAQIVSATATLLAKVKDETSPASPG